MPWTRHSLGAQTLAWVLCRCINAWSVYWRWFGSRRLNGRAVPIHRDREGLLLAPRFECVHFRAPAFALEFVEAIGQVAQRRQGGGGASGGGAGILAQRDITPVMRAVLDRGPVAANERGDLGQQADETRVPR